MKRRLFLAVIPLGVASMALQSTQPAESPPSVGPITYFQSHCVRCHGDSGSNNPDFAKRLSDTKLRKMVDDMCAGPGGEPLKGADLDALIAFHRSIARDEPFICVTKCTKDRWEGEVSSGATLTLNDTSGERPVEVKDGSWSIPLEANATHKRELIARVGDKTVKLTPETDGGFWTQTK